ncbi:ferritin-like domain-containing protein [Comamonadaceae bacterium PP-2]
MSETKTHILEWLRDAHAMEQQAEKTLIATNERLQHYPDFKARVELHLEETRGQARLLEQAIAARGGDTSTLKDFAGRMAARFQGVGAMMAEDEVVKLAIAAYHFEHLEIASYQCLIAAAKATGDADLAEICHAILPQEQAMADWMSTQIPLITRDYLVREQEGVESKR